MGKRLVAVALGGARWTEGTARRVLSTWRASGLSQAAFAAREGIAAQRLGWWRKRLGDWDGEDTRVKLLPAVVRHMPLVGGAPVVTVRLPDGAVIELGSVEEVPASWVGALVRELRRA